MGTKWTKRGVRTPPLSPLALLLSPVIAKAQALGRIQSQCLAKRLSWAAFYTERGNLEVVKGECLKEIEELFAEREYERSVKHALRGTRR